MREKTPPPPPHFSSFLGWPHGGQQPLCHPRAARYDHAKGCAVAFSRACVCYGSFRIVPPRNPPLFPSRETPYFSGLPPSESCLLTSPQTCSWQFGSEATTVAEIPRPINCWAKQSKQTPPLRGCCSKPRIITTLVYWPFSDAVTLFSLLHKLAPAPHFIRCLTSTGTSKIPPAESRPQTPGLLPSLLRFFHICVRSFGGPSSM